MQRRSLPSQIGCLACIVVASLSFYGPATAQTTAAGDVALAGDCPLTSKDFASTDYSSVRAACDMSSMAADQFCSSCVCGLGTAIVLGFEKAGVTINGQPVTALAANGDVDALNTLLSNCSAVMGIELLQAGALTADALGQLATCDVDQSTLNCSAAVEAAQPAVDSGAAPAPPADLAQSSSQPAPGPVAATTPAVKSAGEATGMSVLLMVAALLMGAVLLL